MPPSTPLAIVIRGTDPQQLQDTFGPHIAQQALQHLGRAVTGLLQRLLGQFAPLAHLQRDEEGLWAVLFAERPSALPRSLQEVCASLEAAGQHLLQQTLQEVFGAGTGMRLPCTVQVWPLDRAAWDAWLAQGTPSPAGWPLPAVDTRAQPSLPPQAQDAIDREASATRQIQALLHDGPALRTLLQPIVRMADRRTVGYEALTRGPANSPLERPDRLFAAARACGQTVALELHCAALALQRTARHLPPGQYLTLNLGPQALQHWAQQPQSLPLYGHTNVVVELTEHLPLDQAQALHQGLAHLRQQGLRLALDDTGCGFADLATAQALRPDIVKLCITVVQHATLGTAARAELQQAVAQLHAWGCQVLAEGIETEAQHTALHGYGIPLAQGWLYGKPGEWEHTLAA